MNHDKINDEIIKLAKRVASPYYESNKEALKKAQDAYKEAIKLKKNYLSLLTAKDSPMSPEERQNELDIMYHKFASLNDEDAPYNKIMKNQREESNTGGRRRTRRYKRGGNKKKRMSRRR